MAVKDWPRERILTLRLLAVLAALSIMSAAGSGATNPITSHQSTACPGHRCARRTRFHSDR